MGNVIKLHFTEKTSYIRDEAICPACSKTWTAVIPNTVPHVIICPDCGSAQGVWLQSLRAIEHTKILTCSTCGCQMFYITEHHTKVCAKCGKEADN